MDRLFPFYIAKPSNDSMGMLGQAFAAVGFNALFLFVYAFVITVGVRAAL